MSKNPLLFRPSGINSTFHGSGGTFQDYMQHMQNIVALGRLDLNDQNRNQIIQANSPFEFRSDSSNKKGILLIHGLYDSPFSMQEMGKHLAAQGFLVRALLLPGHGTIPGDLLKIHYEEWIKATVYGVKSFAQQVDQLYLIGYSMGATLALYQALEETSIQGLLLFAPALKPKRLMAYFLNWHQFFNWSPQYPNYYQHVPQKSYAKYESFPYNAAKQVCQLMYVTRKRLRSKSLDIPLFVVATQDDESVSTKATLNFFKQYNNPESRFVLYADSPLKFSDPRIHVRKSVFPDQKILNFSHTSIPFAPTNHHFGRQGDYQDFQHYQDPKRNADHIYQGAILQKNLRRYTIQRLSYNPDFDGMMQMTSEFLANLA